MTAGTLFRCKFCNKNFFDSKSRKRNFCGIKCYRKYQKKFQGEIARKLYSKKKSLICLECKKLFFAYNYRKETSKFCSRKCCFFYMGKHKKEITYRCKKCGKTKRCKMSQFNHYKNAGSFCSNKCRQDFYVGRIPVNYPKAKKGVYKNVKSGNYDINGKTYFFRSRWEANYALYLDFLISKKQIVKWEYEPDVFIFHKIKFGTRSYRPDFKVFLDSGKIEYHEVKGYMDKKSKTKLKRMKKYYPATKVVLIQRAEYEAIKKWSKLLKFY